MIRTEGKSYTFTPRTRMADTILSNTPLSPKQEAMLREVVAEMDDKEFRDYIEMLDDGYIIARDNQNKNRILAEAAADKLFKVNKARHGIA